VTEMACVPCSQSLFSVFRTVLKVVKHGKSDAFMKLVLVSSSWEG
jgi:hypothetical protein